MKLRRHFVLTALAAVLLLAGTVFHTQVLGSGREVFDTDNYVEGEEETEKGRPFEGVGGYIRNQFYFAAAKPASRSARMSSMFSIPIERRIVFC